MRNIISVFVREQQHYTKEQLCKILVCSKSETENFIKILKSYGVLKTVSDENKYIFSYVGIIALENRIVKVYPKYIVSEKNLLSKMKRVIKVLERYSNLKEQIINLFYVTDENETYNSLSLIIYLLNDYYEYGIYNNTENITEINGEGNIIWNRTIDDKTALICDNKPYYTELVTEYKSDDESDYFRELHKFIITECSEQLCSSGLSELFELEPVFLSERNLTSFGENEYILERILKELSEQFNSHSQTLLKMMYLYISDNRKIFSDEDSISLFGTNSFHMVWEKVCSEVFGNQLSEYLGNIHIKSGLAEGYSKNQRLKDIIERPEWCGEDFIHLAKDTLRPDIVTILNYNGEEAFIILDAKYYNLQFEKELPLCRTPGVEDILKQYMYQKAYEKFIKNHNISVVKNGFLIPVDGDKFICKGIVKMAMLSELEDISIRLIPADKIFDCYIKNQKIDVEKLEL